MVNMFEENQKVKITLSCNDLEVYQLMGESIPWFHGKIARVLELVYEEKDFDNSICERFWGVQFYGNQGRQEVVSERQMQKMDN